jgi:hypothetical protein
VIDEKYAKVIDGEPVLSRLGMALLCGVTEAELSAEYERQGRPEALRMPQEWIRKGKAISARIGTDNMAEALAVLIAEHEAAGPDATVIRFPRVPKRIRWNRFDGPLPTGAKSVMRPSRWGNPFRVVGPAATEKNGLAVEQFRLWLMGQPELVARGRLELTGFDLACNCPLGWPCHADVWLRIAAGGEV